LAKGTFYWHDYETWGTDPRRDRPSQFAGLRTDLELNPIGEPLVLYCKPPLDVLPHPEASLVTSLAPQVALEQGVCEAEFIGRIHDELGRSGTCGVGYNSIRFDDEVTRFTLYRNLFDPYAREWRDGNSRWDIIDMVRLTHALRPEGIEWPKREDGNTSLRLEHLTVANGISHEAAHDALSDVHATIGLARLIRDRQPKLYHYAFQHRSKQSIAQLLNLKAQQPVLHVSGMYPSELGNIAMVIPVARHPTNQNGIVVYDLRVDPEPLLSLDAEEIHRRLFTRADELEEGVERIPLKTVHLNKSPVIVPLNTLTPQAAERWGIDKALADRHLGQLRKSQGLAEKIQAVLNLTEFEPESDPDLSLYGGGFFSNADKSRMEKIRSLSPKKLAEYSTLFDDSRLSEMLFRYRARNWPDSLSEDESEQWREFRQERLSQGFGGDSLTLEAFNARLDELRIERESEPKSIQLLNSLDEWGRELSRSAGQV